MWRRPFSDLTRTSWENDNWNCWRKLLDISARRGQLASVMDWQTIITLLASSLNFSLLFVTSGLTNDVVLSVDPLFDRKGCLLVLAWGAAYLSVAWNFRDVPFLFLVFALEKCVYFVHWIRSFRSKATWAPLVNRDPLAKLFYNTYGAGDFLFGVAFFTIFVSGLVAPKSQG